MSANNAARLACLARMRTIGLLIVSFYVCACSTVQLAGYDQKAYENATSLKARTMALIGKSTGDSSYESQAGTADALLVDLEFAYEYANGVEFNNEAARNWRDLIDELIVPLLMLWKDQERLSDAASENFSGQIAEGFDTIICIEANKRQVTSCEALK